MKNIWIFLIACTVMVAGIAGILADAREVQEEKERDEVNKKLLKWADLHEHVEGRYVWGPSPVNAQLQKDLAKVFPKGKRPEATCIYPDGRIGLALEDGTEVALPKADPGVEYILKGNTLVPITELK